MRCECGGKSSIVDSREIGKTITRRRVCASCGQRWTTKEVRVAIIAGLQMAFDTHIPPPHVVCKGVTTRYGLAEEELFIRTTKTLKARRVAMYLLRELSGLTWSAIGRLLNCDRTAAYDAVKVLLKHLEKNVSLQGDVIVIARTVCYSTGWVVPPELLKRARSPTPSDSGRQVEA